MAKVFLTSAAEADKFFARKDYNRVLRAAEIDKFGVHELVEDAAKADVILFVERIDGAGRLLQRVRKHPLMQRFRDKSVVVNPRYKRFPLVPGIYASIKRKWYREDRTRTGHYFEVWDNAELEWKPATGEEPHLFSFTGSYNTAVVRQQFRQLESDDRAYLKDTADDDRLVRSTDDTELLREYRRGFVQTVQDSKFVLCPRGIGPSSLRLFESLLMGRPPVILADEWVAPTGIDWSACSIRLREDEVAKIPGVLREREGDFMEMAAAARTCWEDWFAEDATFHRLVEWSLEILPARNAGGRDWRGALHRLNPREFIRERWR